MEGKHITTLALDEEVWREFKSWCALNDLRPSYEVEMFMRLVMGLPMVLRTRYHKENYGPGAIERLPTRQDMARQALDEIPLIQEKLRQEAVRKLQEARS